MHDPNHCVCGMSETAWDCPVHRAPAAPPQEQETRGGEPWLSLKCWSCFAGIGEPCANQPSICRGRIIAWASTPEAPRDGDGPCPLCGEPGEGYACDCSRGAAPQGPVEAAGLDPILAEVRRNVAISLDVGNHTEASVSWRQVVHLLARIDAHAAEVAQAHAEGRAEGLREARDAVGAMSPWLEGGSIKLVRKDQALAAIECRAFVPSATRSKETTR